MTNEELTELEDLKKEFPYLNFEEGYFGHKFGSINGTTPPFKWESLDAHQLKTMKRLMFLIGKQEGEKSASPIKMMGHATTFQMGVYQQKQKDKEALEIKEDLYSNDPDKIFRIVERAFNQHNSTESARVEFFKKILPSWPISSQKAIKQLSSDDDINFVILKQDSQDSDALKIKQDLESKDVDKVYGLINRALSFQDNGFVEGVLGKIFDRFHCSMGDVVGRKIKSKADGYENFLMWSGLSVKSEDIKPEIKRTPEEIVDAFNAYKWHTKTDDDDVVDLITKLNEEAMIYVDYENQRTIIKNLVEQMTDA